MLDIDRLVLRLPAGFERRAARIGRLTAEALAATPPTAREGHIQRLTLPPQTIRRGWSDLRIAGQLARAIANRLDASGG